MPFSDESSEALSRTLMLALWLSEVGMDDTDAKTPSGGEAAGAGFGCSRAKSFSIAIPFYNATTIGAYEALNSTLHLLASTPQYILDLAE
jgi:hypothetical protein